jgi:hypothetical protein
MSRILRAAAVSALALALIVTPATIVLGRTTAPILSVVSVLHHIDVTRYDGDPYLYLPSGVYLASPDGPFELDVTTEAGMLYIRQVVRTGERIQKFGLLPRDPRTNFSEGLFGFSKLELLDGSGNVLGASASPFCPNNGWPTRVNASGPDRPTYPFFCGGPLTKSTVWGIDRGWAVPAFSSMLDPGVPDGDYTLRFSVTDRYVRALHLDPAATTVTVGITIDTYVPPPCDPEPCPLPHGGARAARAARAAADSRVPQASDRSAPAIDTDARGLPDLAALPAHSMMTEHTDDGHDRLDFGATIWNAGTGPLVIEGFRNNDQPVMQATQFIYDRGRRVGSAPAGAFEYDPQPGHEHWHYFGIANYDLLTGGGGVVESDKRSFCLAPTDAIDLVAPGAEWLPDRFGLGSACGGADAIWLREVLPAGWGDTYIQSLPGQSFDITTVPNGRYVVRVTADPTHQLREQRYNNNVANVTVELGGTPGDRTVEIV